VIVSGSDDTTICVWDAVSGDLLTQPLSGHTGAVRAVALGRFRGRDVIFSGGDDETVRVWDANTGDIVVVQDTLGPVLAIAATPTELAVAVGRAVCVFET
jgi:WD40 repeat protein